MARPAKIEVSAVNIRIAADRDRDYVALINELVKMRVAVRVFGDTFVALENYDEDKNLGAIAKYTEIDIDGDWFDLESFTPADPERLKEVVIPGSLRPNYSAFLFTLLSSNHVVAFESYSDSKMLSARSVERFFRGALNAQSILEKYGRVEVDIVKSYSEIDRILSLADLKELRIVIRRPNADDISGDLAREIEERLREQKGEEYEEVLRSKDRDGLDPNERTKRLALVGAENGEVSAKSLVNGVLSQHSTDESPEKTFETFNREDVSGVTVFRRLADELRDRIVTRRKIISGQES